MQRDLLEQHLSREELQALKNKQLGMFIFQLSWIMVFISLVVVNWQLRFSPNWLPEGSERAGRPIATLATVALLLSAALAHRSLKAVKADDLKAFLMQWQATIALGGLFISMMVYEWFAIVPGTQYAQVFRLMTGFHVIHALIIGLYMVNVFLNGRMGAYGGLHFWAVEAGAKLWYFVVVAWMLFYFVIYWV